MTHEIKQLFETTRKWQEEGKRAALVSVVDIDGSSYRRPGVRMIVNDGGETEGAVSGGCVENEIIRQAQLVFQSGRARLITYDGRFRLGCEGIVYILIEPVQMGSELLAAFDDVIQKRKTFVMESYYRSEVGEHSEAGTLLRINNKAYSIRPGFSPVEDEKMECFTQYFQPPFQLYVFGAEHDAVELCKVAVLLGWDVVIVSAPDEEKTLDYFPGAKALIAPAFDAIDTSWFDRQTAIVVMSHSFNKDVQYLLALYEARTGYFGLLGPVHRRERILEKLLDYRPNVPSEFFEQLHGPAGINLGAETAAEIAVSIVAEILSVMRHQQPIPLREKAGPIHE